MWDLPKPGIEPMSPAVAGVFLATGPPRKSNFLFFSIFLAVPGLRCGIKDLWFAVACGFLVAACGIY